MIFLLCNLFAETILQEIQPAVPFMGQRATLFQINSDPNKQEIFATGTDNDSMFKASKLLADERSKQSNTTGTPFKISGRYTITEIRNASSTQAFLRFQFEKSCYSAIMPKMKEHHGKDLSLDSFSGGDIEKNKTFWNILENSTFESMVSVFENKKWVFEAEKTVQKIQKFQYDTHSDLKGNLQKINYDLQKADFLEKFKVLTAQQITDVTQKWKEFLESAGISLEVYEDLKKPNLQSENDFYTKLLEDTESNEWLKFALMCNEKLKICENAKKFKKDRQGNANYQSHNEQKLKELYGEDVGTLFSVLKISKIIREKAISSPYSRPLLRNQLDIFETTIRRIIQTDEEKKVMEKANNNLLCFFETSSLDNDNSGEVKIFKENDKTLLPENFLDWYNENIKTAVYGKIIDKGTGRGNDCLLCSTSYYEDIIKKLGDNLEVTDSKNDRLPKEKAEKIRMAVHQLIVNNFNENIDPLEEKSGAKEGSTTEEILKKYRLYTSDVALKNKFEGTGQLEPEFITVAAAILKVRPIFVLNHAFVYNPENGKVVKQEHLPLQNAVNYSKYIKWNNKTPAYLYWSGTVGYGDNVGQGCGHYQVFQVVSQNN